MRIVEILEMAKVGDKEEDKLIVVYWALKASILVIYATEVSNSTSRRVPNAFSTLPHEYDPAQSDLG